MAQEEEDINVEDMTGFEEMRAAAAARKKKGEKDGGDDEEGGGAPDLDM